MKRGKIYLVKHTRKGNFRMKVIEDSGEWVSGIVIEGIANAIMDYNIKEEGEKITVRKGLCRFIPETIVWRRNLRNE